MKGDQLDFFKEFSYKLLTYNRLVGTHGHRRALELAESFLEYLSVLPQKEVFSLKEYLPQESWLQVAEEKIKAVAHLGVKSVELEGYLKRDYLQGDIALIPDLSRDKALRAQEGGASAIVTYTSTGEYLYGGYTGLSIPVLSVREADLPKVEDFKVSLRVNSVEKNLQGTNLLLELGRGPVIYITAHLDTVHGGYGALCSGVGVALLLFLYMELKDNYKVPYRLRFLLTDAREMGSKGARFHLRGSTKHIFYCINLEGVGWHNPCVVYKDAGGYNGERINELFYKHLQDVGVKMDFCSAEDRDGDHIPFKEKGVQTLFLSSCPLTVRHTTYDNYEAVCWDTVELWYEVILSFLRRFHRL